MLRPLQNGNQRLWLRGLSRFIDQDLSETDVADASVKSCDTGCADYISVTEDLILSLPLKLFELLIVAFR